MNSASVLSRMRIDPAKPTPPYYQLQEELAACIAEGELRPGDELPSVAQLADRAGVNKNTVLRTLTELASDGAIIRRRGLRARVAEPRAATTELLFWTSRAPATGRVATHLHELEASLQKGFADPNRRVWTSNVGRNRLNAPELLAVCRARNADSIVTYRPPRDSLDVLRRVAESLPVVSLFSLVPDTQAHCVLPDPAEAVRRVVLDRVQRGCTHFAYAGNLDLYREKAAPSPYLEAHAAFVRALAESGKGPPEYLKIDAADASAHRCIDHLPADAMLLTAYPQLGMDLDPKDRLDKISYTECHSTLALARGRMTVLYLSVERFGQVAAQLLDARDDAPRVLRLVPETIVGDKP